MQQVWCEFVNRSRYLKPKNKIATLLRYKNKDLFTKIKQRQKENKREHTWEKTQQKINVSVSFVCLSVRQLRQGACIPNGRWGLIYLCVNNNDR